MLIKCLVCGLENFNIFIICIVCGCVLIILNLVGY